MAALYSFIAATCAPQRAWARANLRRGSAVSGASFTAFEYCSVASLHFPALINWSPIETAVRALVSVLEHDSAHGAASRIASIHRKAFLAESFTVWRIFSIILVPFR